MSNVGIYGFPSGSDPKVDQNTPVMVGPKWRDPTARTNWPPTISTLNAANGANLFEQSPAGNTVLPCSLEWAVVLRAGTWAVSFHYVMGAVYGISEVFLDGMSLGTIDQYLSTTSSYIVSLTKNITVSDGFHTLKLAKTGTKNASASDYYCSFIDLTLRRVA